MNTRAAAIAVKSVTTMAGALAAESTGDWQKHAAPFCSTFLLSMRDILDSVACSSSSCFILARFEPNLAITRDDCVVPPAKKVQF